MSGPSGGVGVEVAADLVADPARQAAVARLLAAGTRSEGLDRLTRLAANLLGVGHAQISLLTSEQHVASVAGLDLDRVGTPGPAADSLCTVTVRSGGALAVADAANDPRVRRLPPVVSGAVGAYLGVPLVDSDGMVLGALCVFDEEPRTWSTEQVGVLGELAPAVVAELELRAVTLEVATSAARLDLALEAADIGSFDWDMRSGQLAWDDRLVALFGFEEHAFDGRFETFAARLHEDDADRVRAELERATSTGEFSSSYRIVLPDGRVRWLEARGRVLRGGPGRGDRMLGAAYDTSGRHAAEDERERAYREREQAVVERERAYAHAEAANTRLQLLVDATARLGASLRPEQVLDTLASTVVPAMGRWAVVAAAGDIAAALAEEDGAPPDVVVPLLVRHSDVRQQASLEQLVRALPLSLSDPHGLGAVLRTGVPEWLPDVDEAVLSSFGFDEATLQRVRDLQVGRAFTVPLLSRGRRLGALAVAEPLTGVLDRALLLDLAGRAAVALDNALLYRAERRAGITLQRSLLPREVPQLPGVEVAAEYHPGDDGAFVGGDWYQGVVVEHRLVLAMGDVMGHGMRSAARMGQLRAIVATLALEGHPPGALLERLARSTDALLDLDLATLLVARLDPATGRLELASAGHPPPVLAVEGDEPRFLDVPPGPPLGTFPGHYEQIAVDVPVGATLVLYTDGLVENRQEPLGTGLERLRGALHDLRRPPAQVAQAVLAATGREGGAEDDVALLVLRRTGLQASAPQPGRP
jgi:serine phosphatase RsbU (regulator of sigma subunit)/PAS domain-containing protein